jgi:hypothetical protein
MSFEMVVMPQFLERRNRDLSFAVSPIRHPLAESNPIRTRRRTLWMRTRLITRNCSDNAAADGNPLSLPTEPAANH